MILDNNVIFYKLAYRLIVDHLQIHTKSIFFLQIRIKQKLLSTMKSQFLSTLANKHNPSNATTGHSAGISNGFIALFKPKNSQQQTHSETDKKSTIRPQWVKIIEQYKDKMKDYEPQTQNVEEPVEEHFEEFSIIIGNRMIDDRVASRLNVKVKPQRRQHIQKTIKKPISTKTNYKEPKIESINEKSLIKDKKKSEWFEEQKTIPLHQSHEFSYDNDITLKDEPTLKKRCRKAKPSPKLQRLDFVINLAKVQISQQKEKSKGKNKSKINDLLSKYQKDSQNIQQNDVQANKVNNTFQQQFLCDLKDLQEWQTKVFPQKKNIQVQKKHYQLMPKLERLDFRIALEYVDSQQINKQNIQFQKDKIQPKPPIQAIQPIQVIQPIQLQKEVEEQVQIIEMTPKPQKKLNKQTSNKDDKDVEFVKTNRVYPFQIGKASLKDLVEQLYYKSLINQQVYKQFAEKDNLQNTQDFLEKFYSGKLHHFNYQKFKITLLDHRRISELLTNLFPGEYYLGDVLNPNQQIQDFLGKMYVMSGEEYFKLCTKIDKISRVKWWNKILLAQEERLSSSYKEKKMNQKHAERADLAVKEVIQSFLFKKNPIIENNNNLSQNQVNQRLRENRSKRQKLN